MQEREHKIRKLAHALWEADGRPDGREKDHWHEAERQIATEEAGDPAAKPAKALGKKPAAVAEKSPPGAAEKQRRRAVRTPTA